MTTVLPWNQTAISDIEEAKNAGRLAHALRADAPAGWGSEAFAGQLAARILGLPGDLAAESAHADLHWLAPEGAEIKVDEVRHFNQWAANKPFSAKCKVAVVLHSHRMNANAANALLKTLEEPPPDTYLILQTEQPARLLATVRSRCQRLPVHVNRGMAEAWLKDQHPDASSFLDEVGGGPMDALALALGEQQPVADGLALLANEGSREKQLKALLDDDLVAWLGRWYRLAIARIGSAPTESDSLIKFADELLNTRRQIESSNSANARLLLERLIFLWQRLV